MKDRELREQLVQACRVLFDQGHEHFYLGHVSVRATTPGLIWVKPTGVGLEEVEAEDMALANLAGEKLEGERKLHTEMPIHTEIYRARPEVAAVAHTHAFHAAALTASQARFEMVSQDSLFFATGLGWYDSAELVESPAQGAELARCLGSLPAALMKNHGLTAVGASLEQVVLRAVSLERSCRTQLAAAQLGGASPIPADQVERMAVRFERQSGREHSLWRYMVRSAERRA